MLYFSKNWFFQTFDQSNLFFNQSKLRLKFLVWVFLTWLMFNRFSIDRIVTEKFSVSMFLTKIFFMHHLCLGFTCIALFLYPSCSFAIISLIIFTYNMHTLYYIGYSIWSKNWMINFWAIYFLVYAFFYVWTVENIFLKQYDG